jgi:hypothetical protein
MKIKFFGLALTAVLILASSFIKAQGSDFTLKNNMVLHYEINGSIDFKVKLLELGDQVRYAWYRDDVKGFEVTLTADAMENAFMQLNYIYGMLGMPPQKYSNATSVFFSRKLLEALKNGEKPIIFPHQDGEENPVEVEVWDNPGTIIVEDRTSGQSIQIPYMVVLGENDEIFYILEDSRFPLILWQILDFSIILVAIEY